jgi:hypothetical protein
MSIAADFSPNDADKRRFRLIRTASAEISVLAARCAVKDCNSEFD